MKIKTIVKQLSFAQKFDDEVNAALAAGWVLRQRRPLSGCRLTETTGTPPQLYAELVLPEPPQETMLDTDTAAQIVGNVCKSCSGCHHCPLQNICSAAPPNRWRLAAEKAQKT